MLRVDEHRESITFDIVEYLLNQNSNMRIRVPLTWMVSIFVSEKKFRAGEHINCVQILMK